jgi:Na+/H+-dicarboxylate symporter
MVVASTLNCAEAGLSCSETDLVVAPVVAVSFTVCVVDTADASAVKPTVVDVAGMVTEAGTVTFVLLLLSATVTPPCGADPDKVTLQESDAEPMIVVVLQDIALTVGAVFVPVPLRLTTSVPAVVESVN